MVGKVSVACPSADQINGLYTAKMNHVPVVSIVSQIQLPARLRLLPGGGPAQAVRRRGRVQQLVTGPETVPAVMDEIIRMAYLK
ncbi:hypothetical protein CRD59_06435 [Bifidobacterium xylocopae]|uniref:Uncharacterized protein n=1 Tax=Bifidobacterium xylocopae TaxID=2493119 RepID=A0A366KCL8_9BIFI|nr:hypothetical protein CRD59_06435 [Bifidobacterium xylocopae]